MSIFAEPHGQTKGGFPEIHIKQQNKLSFGSVQAVNKQVSELPVKPAVYGKSNQAIYEIPCFVGAGNKKRIDSLGDSGARSNFIRDGIAITLFSQVDRSVLRKVRIWSGEAIESTEIARTVLRFAGEKIVHALEFILLPSCAHEVTLGNPFLNLTKTFSNISNFARRVKKRLRNLSTLASSFLYLEGGSGPKFEGYGNHLQMGNECFSKLSVLKERSQPY